MKTYTFSVPNVHCPSCKIFIEDAAREESGVVASRVNLASKSVEIDVDGDRTPEELAHALTQRFQSSGYEFVINHAVINDGTTRSWRAVLAGVAVLGAFFLLQKSGVLNFGFGGTVTWFTAFIIGLVASVSSCLAVVGGLVLSLSAKVSQDDVSDTKTFTLFHVSRIVSFAVLGGVLGATGSILAGNFTVSAILGIVTASVMIVLGLNLMGFIGQAFTITAAPFRLLQRFGTGSFAPVVLGFATFFLPCGFTQSMQFAALESGSFVAGSLLMLAFALGTLPVLAALSFGSASFARTKYASDFFTASGVVALGFGLFALVSGLVALGVISPFFNV